MTLGNTIEILGTKIAMPTSRYKRSDEDLSQEEINKGLISFDGLLIKTVAWAATDLNLELKSPNEKKK